MLQTLQTRFYTDWDFYRRVLAITLPIAIQNVINLGVMVSQEEYIAAAIESKADAIVVSSLYGQGELDCRGMREKCDEAGLKGIPLLVGGNIVIGKQRFEDVEARFHAMGFDRAFPPGTMPEVTIAALREILHVSPPEDEKAQDGR